MAAELTTAELATFAGAELAAMENSVLILKKQGSDLFYRGRFLLLFVLPCVCFLACFPGVYRHAH